MKEEKVIQSLKEMGFNPEQLDTHVHVFTFEENPFVLFSDDDDETLRITIPNILDIDENNELAVYEAMNEINLSIKYIKLCKFGDSVWCFHEQRHDEDDDLEDLIRFSILLLGQAATAFLNYVTGEHDDEEGGDASC